MGVVTRVHLLHYVTFVTCSPRGNLRPAWSFRPAMGEPSSKLSSPRPWRRRLWRAARASKMPWAKPVNRSQSVSSHQNPSQILSDGEGVRGLQDGVPIERRSSIRVHKGVLKLSGSDAIRRSDSPAHAVRVPRRAAKSVFKLMGALVAPMPMRAKMPSSVPHSTKQGQRNTKHQGIPTRNLRMLTQTSPQNAAAFKFSEGTMSNESAIWKPGHDLH